MDSWDRGMKGPLSVSEAWSKILLGGQTFVLFRLVFPYLCQRSLITKMCNLLFSYQPGQQGDGKRANSRKDKLKNVSYQS